MKKTLLAAVLAVAMIGLTACGSKTEEAAPAADEAVVEEAPAADEAPVAEEAAPADETAATEEVAVDDAAIAAEVNEFATKIVAAVDAKDIEALSELVTYPTYVAIGDGMEVASKEDFVAIGADALFTDELVASVDAADLSALEATGAGYILGGEKPDIIFGYGEDNTLGITGINY